VATNTQAEKLLQYVRRHGIIRPRDLEAIDVPRSVLMRLVGRGRLVRQSRGIYTTPDYEPTENTGLAQVATRVPRAVICLLSALRFHGLTTQNPFEVWIMIDKAGHRPVLERPAVRIVWASGDALRSGVEEHQVEGVTVHVTSPAKTVADCFRYRRRVGVDVAIEGLRDCWQQRKATMDALYRYAKIDRVANVMRPYMETLT